jgi:glycosyltransferase involved in cell wall biosynthesis
MIKVLELIDGGFLGGGQIHILSIAENINKTVFDISIAASPEGEFRNIISKHGYKFFDITLPKIYRSKYLKQLEEIVWKDNIDIIHSHGGVAGMYARFLKKKYQNFKIIHTIHGIHYINSKNPFRNFFTKTIEQYLVPFTDKFICVSDHDFLTADRIGIIDKDKTVIIKNGIDLKRFTAKPENKILTGKLGLNKKNIVIGNVSRFDYQKNQRQIIRIAKQVLDKKDHVRFLFVGDGKYLETCKRMVMQITGSENINKFIFTGEVSNVEDYYPLIDIFIFPSLWEGYSITLLEALASSKCILASDIDPNKEIINNNVNGILFKKNDDESLYNNLQSLLENNAKRIFFESNALASSENFSSEKMNSKIEDQYKELASK